MQTLRLQTLVNPAHTEHLLDSYVSRSRRVPETATRPLDVTTVPRELRVIAARARATGSVCSFWCDSGHTWLFIASQSLQRGREFGRPVLEIQSRNPFEEGSMYLIAVQLPDGSWCEHSE